MRTYSLKIFYKYLSKNKLYSFVTLTGFAISLMFVLLLSVYITEELSVDQFHTNKDRIFRLVREDHASFAAPIGSFIMDRYPEAEAYTRIYQSSWNVIFNEGRQERVRFLLADSAFFSMFSFKLEAGDPETVLAARNSAVLSSSFARKVFGDENPVGKTFVINNITFNISGIYKDFPDNTHFQKCDAILNFPVLADIWGYKELLTTNNNSSFGLYFMSGVGTDLPSKAPMILEQFKKDYWLYTEGYSKTLGFEPLAEVYFSKESGPAIRQNSKSSIFIFGAVTLLILIIAIINYINLTIAQAWYRTKATSIKKMMGCSKTTLVWQYVIDSVTLSLSAAILALYLAFLAEPFFDSQMQCRLNLSTQFNLSFAMILLGIIIITGFISGIIPALVVNRFNPLDAVKGIFNSKGKNNYTKILISFQYCVAVVLLTSTWAISRQAQYMQNYNIGFNRENIFWMENTIAPNQRSAFRDILKSVPGVVDVSYCQGNPLDGGNNQSFNYNGKPVSFQEFVVDSVFFRLTGIKITNSRAAYSKNGVWINRQAAEALDLGENPVSFKYYGNEVPLLGILDNFNFRSLHTRIGPLIVRQLGSDGYPWSILVKLDGSNLIATVNKIRKEQATFTKGVPMDSGLMDESINQYYIKEVKQSRLLGAFTLLSIIIASMGIFALALYYIQKKVKEIGIRKINGAKVSQVIIMLNKEFINWVVLAFMIACPVAGFGMHKWLQNFPYRITLNWWIFAGSGFLAIIIALFTITWQSFQAASRNPVEALRYE